MNERELKIYKDGASVRLHNRRIGFKQDEKGIHIRAAIVDDKPDHPRCFNKVVRGKICVTGILFSEEGFDALVAAYMYFKQSK